MRSSREGRVAGGGPQDHGDEHNTPGLVGSTIENGFACRRFGDPFTILGSRERRHGFA